MWEQPLFQSANLIYYDCRLPHEIEENFLNLEKSKNKHQKMIELGNGPSPKSGREGALSVKRRRGVQQAACDTSAKRQNSRMIVI